MRRSHLARRGGFTMVEVMIAAALLGFSLIVMFGFHGQAVRSNMNARRLTDCTYLAQTQMERLVAMDWGTIRPGDLEDGGVDASSLSVWDDLEWPGTSTDVGATGESTATDLLPTTYRVSWDVEDMDPDSAAGTTWVRLRVRCTYPDSAFYNTRHGTTISTFRFKDS